MDSVYERLGLYASHELRPVYHDYCGALLGRPPEDRLEHYLMARCPDCGKTVYQVRAPLTKLVEVSA